MSGSLLTILDPAQKPVAQISDGDLRHDGFATTIFQISCTNWVMHWTLGHNTSDMTSIMNRVLGSGNPVPDAQVASGIQSLYGAPVQLPALGTAAGFALHDLLAGTPLNGFA